MRTEDRLDGAANFVSWNAQILVVLRENELCEEVVENTTTNPIASAYNLEWGDCTLGCVCIGFGG